MSTQPLFYVKDISGGLHLSTFLTDAAGNPIKSVVEPTTSTSVFYQQLPDQSWTTITNLNPNDYLVVPASYTLAQAVSAGTFVAGLMTISAGPHNETVSGLPAAYGAMVGMFVQGGSQDLQRVYDGMTGPAVPAYVAAASFNLGVVTAVAGINRQDAVLGGGIMNQILNFVRDVKVDQSGTAGLSATNELSLYSGYAVGQSLASSSALSLAKSALFYLAGSSSDTLLTGTFGQSASGGISLQWTDTSNSTYSFSSSANGGGAATIPADLQGNEIIVYGTPDNVNGLTASVTGAPLIQAAAPIRVTLTGPNLQITVGDNLQIWSGPNTIIRAGAGNTIAAA